MTASTVCSESRRGPQQADRTCVTGHQSDSGLCLHISGSWTMQTNIPPLERLRPLLEQGQGELSFNTDQLRKWDSRFLIFIKQIKEVAGQQGLSFTKQGLPEGVCHLLRMAESGQGEASQPVSPGLLFQLGEGTFKALNQLRQLQRFIGAIALSCVRLLRGQAQMLRSDLFQFLHDCGPAALPIVSLISVLVGIILAFVGTVQLKNFGAEIYVADLVALGMTREMGAMMAAIIMAGRTGAAFAAQIGTMQVNEEIDALRTMGINPIDFLVLPRVLALTLMMPLLALWADLLGITGGLLVAWLTMDLSMVEYVNQSIAAIGLDHYLVGLSKAVAFGYLVAIAGCLRGMQCGRSAQAVGVATTSAVVTAIVFIVLSDALFTFLFNVLDI